jgi:outer membrane protein TolC
MKKKFCLFIILCFLPTHLFAQIDNKVLGIDEILDLVSRNNLQLQMAKHKYNIAEAQTGGAWSSIFPKFSLQSGYNKMDSYSTRAALNFAVPSYEMDYYSTKLSLNQVLFNNSAFTAISVSNYGLNMAKNDFLATKEDVYFNTLKLYLTIIQLEKQLEILNDSKVQMDKILNKVESLKSNGMATQIDVLRTKTSISSLKVGINTFSNTIKTMYLSLEMILNCKIGNNKLDPEIIDKLFEDKIIQSDIILAEVYKNRFDYQSLESTIKLLEANVFIQESAVWPSLIVVGSYGFIDTNGFKFANNNKDWSVGLNCIWNFFDSGSTGAKVAEAKENYEILKKQESQIKIAIENELTINQLNLDAAKDKIDSISEEVDLNIEVVNQINSKYLLGEVTNLELLDSQNQLLNAKNKLLSAKIEYALEVLKSLKTTGQIAKYFNKGGIL